MTITRPSAASEWIAANPAPEPVIPAGRVRCPDCDGSGEAIQGFHDCAPNQERCPRCHGFGHVPGGFRTETEQRAMDAQNGWDSELAKVDWNAARHKQKAIQDASTPRRWSF